MDYKFNGSGVLFTSDTHFNHTNIIRFCSRPFKDVEHMNEHLLPTGTVWSVRIISYFILATSVLVALLNGQRYSKG